MLIVNSLRNAGMRLLCPGPFGARGRTLAVPLFDAAWMKSLCRSLRPEDAAELTALWASCVEERTRLMSSSRTDAERMHQAQGLWELAASFGASRLETASLNFIAATRRGAGRCELETLKEVSKSSSDAMMQA